VPKAYYDVTTWDPRRQAFTPQRGVRRGPYTLWGLRRALRRLRELGYACDRHDPAVLVERRERI
jgi:hypothetical protein